MNHYYRHLKFSLKGACAYIGDTLYRDIQPTVNFALLLHHRCSSIAYYIGKVDYNGNGNDIGYADATEMVSWC